jgi:hypothetical protein
MTWSQLQVFARAARIAALQDYQMQLTIAHNPYRKDADRLVRQLSQAIARERSGRSAGKGEVSVKQLEAFFGKAKRKTATKEEIEAKAKPRPRGTFKR